MGIYEEYERLVELSEEEFVKVGISERDFESDSIQSLQKSLEHIQVHDRELLIKSGRALIENEIFLLDEQVTFLAHGSYGAATKAVCDIGDAWRREIERQPVVFFYKTLYPFIARSVRSVCRMIGANHGHVVLIPNVEFGMHAVVNSLIDAKELQLIHTVVTFDILYGATYKWLHSLANTKHFFKLEIIQISDTVHNGNSAIVQRVKDYLSTASESTIKLAIFEHVTSPTAIVLPVDELTDAFHFHGISVLIDGAHGLGMIPHLSLAESRIDFYVTNAHKWLCNLRGCGALFIRDIHAANALPLKPVLTSWGGDREHFQSAFVWQGTLDYTPWLTLYSAERIHEILGGHSLMIRNIILNQMQAEYLTKTLSTRLLVPIEQSAAMACIQIPDLITTELVNDITDVLRREYNIEVPSFTFNNSRWMRISTHVYNEESDFQKLLVALQKLIEECARVNDPSCI